MLVIYWLSAFCPVVYRHLSPLIVVTLSHKLNCMKNQLLNKLALLRNGSVKLGLMLALGTITGTAVAQTNVTVGVTTDGSAQWLPIHGVNSYSYSQQLYYPAQFGVYAGQSSTITKLRFFYVSGTPSANNTLVIYMGNTAQNTFAGTAAANWIPVASMTEVFNGTVTYPAANNWVEITLSTPFVWNGTSNLVIGVDENSATSGATLFQKTEVGTNRSMYHSSNFTNFNPAAPITASGRHGHVPNIQLEMTPSLACSGQPGNGLTVTSDADICTGDSVVLSSSNAYYMTGISYQWQQYDGAVWTDIPSATASTLNSGALTANMEYRTIVTCANSMESDTTTSVMVNVHSYPTVSVNSTNIVTCSGDPANIIASGTDTYLWSPTTGLTPSATQDTVYMLPTAQTVYRVIGTTAGCADTAFVTVTPITVVGSDVTFDPIENCAPGSLVTATISELPSEITSGGEWQYRWLGPDGVELQPWGTTNEYSFTPAADSVYGMYYQIRSTSCPDELDSIYTSITIGFGADVELTHFDCNSQGIIELSNIFGQKEGMEIYDNAFSSADGAAVFTGSGALIDGRAVLTPSATSVSGYLQITATQQTATGNPMRVSFNMTNDQPINTWGTGGADGLTYSFGDDATPAGNGTPVNGKGTKLRLSFDSAGNGAENGNAPGIYLVYGWTANNAFGPGNSQTLAYSTNTALWKLLTDVPVVLEINNLGQATVTVNGEVVFSNIQLPPGYVNADITNWKHLFSAGTGGDALRQAIDDLVIESKSSMYGITAGAGTTTPPTDWQSQTSFEDLLPGVYNVWISKDTTGDCSKNIGAFEILNTYPIVDLGNDTTICAGETLILDAENPGSTYTWSGTNAFTQTIEVDETGSYIVYVTSPAGCLGIGNIDVDVLEAPSATGFDATMVDFTGYFTAIGSQNVDNYHWDFGDGESIDNAAGSVSHTYDDYGTYTVTLTVSNDCGEEEYEVEVEIIDYTSLSENSIAGLEVYPNPAKDQVTISIPNSMQSEVRVFNMAGAQILSGQAFTSSLKLDVATWEKGVYFLQISNEGQTTVSKLIVQ